MKARQFTPAFIFFMAVIFGLQPINAQNVAINADGSAPNSSAMLDVQSANKGLLIPQINLSSLTDATTITSPAHSLLVYNTNELLAEGVGFYYNSGTTGSPIWSKFVASGTEWKLSGNAGTTPGTDFIGTTDAKDLVLKTNGSSRVNINSAGITTIGNGTNDTRIEADGSLFFEGTATTFNDIVVPLFNTKIGESGNQPSWVKMKDNGSGSRGVYTFTFANQSTANEQEVFFSLQLPHNWKEGSPIFPHVHWSPQTTGQDGEVVWGLEYTWVNYNAATPLAFPNTSLIAATSSAITGTSDADKHFITALGSITPDGTQNKISSILMCRFYRKSGDAADTYNGTAAVLSVDFHYEIDGTGSHTEYVK